MLSQILHPENLECHTTFSIDPYVEMMSQHFTLLTLMVMMMRHTYHYSGESNSKLNLLENS